MLQIMKNINVSAEKIRNSTLVCNCLTTFLKTRFISYSSHLSCSIMDFMDLTCNSQALEPNNNQHRK